MRAAEIGDHLQGDVVVLAIPYTAVDDVLGAYAGQLDGKVVVDITNPVDFSAFTLLHPGAGSAAQEIAGKAPGARVVKAFNTTFAGTLLEGRVADQPVDVLIASDDEDAKETVGALVDDGGLRAVDAGPLTRARGTRVARLSAYGAAGSAGHRVRQRREVHRVTDSMATDTLAQVATLRSVPVAPSGPPPAEAQRRPVRAADAGRTVANNGATPE